MPDKRDTSTTGGRREAAPANPPASKAPVRPARIRFTDRLRSRGRQER